MSEKSDPGQPQFGFVRVTTCVIVICLGGCVGLLRDNNQSISSPKPAAELFSTTVDGDSKKVNGYVEIDGLKMYYEVHGAGANVLLLHGGGSFIPERWIDFLSSKYQVIAVEQIGHGRTGDIAERQLSYHKMAEDTFALLRKLKIESTMIVGYSDGGNIGLDLAIHHPDVVSKLAVTGAIFNPSGLKVEMWKWLNSNEVYDWQAPDHYGRLSPDGVDHWPAFRDRLVKMWKAQPNFTLTELSKIEAPTLVIIGDQDDVSIEHATQMFQLIANAQLCVVPNSRHGVMPSQAVMKFLAE